MTSFSAAIEIKYYDLYKLSDKIPMINKLGIIIVCLFFSSWAQAEYRVFLLKISKNSNALPVQTMDPSLTPNEATKDTDPNVANRNPASVESPDNLSTATDPQEQDFRLIESTLDPEQYRGYYQIAADETIVYIDTWMCRGRTNHLQSFCPNPKAQNVESP